VSTTSKPISVLLQASRNGDSNAADELFATVYAELKLLARSHRRRWRGNHTVNTTVLLHELFIKLSDNAGSKFENRTHFFATASRAMRQVLVSYARQQGAAKRGGSAPRITLDEASMASPVGPDELLDLVEILDRLEKDNPRQCRVVECRVLGGMTVQEVADALDISTATVKRDWQVASARIYRDMHKD
jgi:RNA polymerase sigma factor (TIGR02999 family)